MAIWEQFAPELMTDLYELTMAASYFEEGMSGEATFSLFIRDYPPGRAYFVSAGLEQVLELLSGLRFRDSSLQYLRSTSKFSPALIDYLGGLRFSGSVRAIPEGRIFFSQEPILEVTAPIIEAQLVETLVLNTIQLESMIASKAARSVHAAAGRPLIDFSMRRTQGIEASIKAARSSFIAGFQGTSNVLAGKIFSIPTYGTMAHSYISSFESEMDAFLAFARVFPDNTVLLIDTYDTLTGAMKAVEVARIMAAQGKKLLGVRLDSGDLAGLSRKVRKIFQKAGFPEVRIMASGNLDEFKVEGLVREGAEIDVFAVGTRLGVSADAPYLDIAYKLVEYAGKPTLKLSTGKKTWAGKKQVYRYYNAQGRMDRDRLCLLDSPAPAGAEPLLEEVMRDGRPARAPEPLDAIRARFAEEWRKLPEPFRELRPVQTYPVEICERLIRLDEHVSEEKRCKEVDAAAPV